MSSLSNNSTGIVTNTTTPIETQAVLINYAFLELAVYFGIISREQVSNTHALQLSQPIQSLLESIIDNNGVYNPAKDHNGRLAKKARQAVNYNQTPNPGQKRKPIELTTQKNMQIIKPHKLKLNKVFPTSYCSLKRVS